MRLLGPSPEEVQTATVGATWTYRVVELGARHLNFWGLGIESCLPHLLEVDPLESADSGTFFYGLGWEVGAGFESGDFTFTLNGDYPASATRAESERFHERRSEDGARWLKVSAIDVLALGAGDRRILQARAGKSGIMTADGSIPPPT